MRRLLAVLTLCFVAADGAIARKALAEDNLEPAPAAQDDTGDVEAGDKKLHALDRLFKELQKTRAATKTKADSEQLARVKTLARTDPARAAELAVKLFPRESYKDGEITVSYAHGMIFPQTLQMMRWEMRGAPTETSEVVESFDNAWDVGFRSTDGSRAVVSVAEQWGKEDPEKAAEWALSTGSSRAVATVAGAWANKDPAKGCDFALKVSNAWMRDAVVPSLCRQWASKDPAKAAAWVSDLKGESTAKLRSVYYVAAEWALEDPKRAAQWARSFGPDRTRRLAETAIREAAESGGKMKCRPAFKKGQQAIIRLKYVGGLKSWDGALHFDDGVLTLINNGSLTVVNKNGMLMPRKGKVEHSREAVMNRPFDTLVDLAEVFDLSQPGRYLVTWGSWQAHARTVEFEIVE